jgi:NAD(P)H-nitrite reductase large subunit
MLKDGDRGVILQRDKQTYGIAPNIPCGMCTPEILRTIATVAEKYHLAIKLTSADRIALLGIREEDVDTIWAELGMKQGNVTGICVRSVKVCPGTTFCKRGQQDSIAIGKILDEKFHGMPLPGKSKIGASGCVFQCAETNFKDIGLYGTPKGWTLLAGGIGGGARARIADKLTENLSTEQALAMIDKLVAFYQANAKPGERLGRTIERLGLDTVKSALGIPLSPTTPPKPATA